MSNYDALLRETVARHFPRAVIADATLHLGFGELQMECSVDKVIPWGESVTASLFFWLTGGRLGKTVVFMSASGYGPSAEQAVAEGGCIWTCTVGPVLRAGFADETVEGITSIDMVLDSEPVRVFFNGFDRAIALKPNEPIERRILATRDRFGAKKMLLPTVLASTQLPVFDGSRPTVLSVFVMDGASQRVVEVKVDGHDWRGMERLFAGVAAEPEGAMVMMRDLAVVVPLQPAGCPSRQVVEQSLAGVIADEQWLGWQHHGGVLQAPLGAAELNTLEQQLGRLPADYREFLLHVSEAGAGPGYGLLSPRAAIQKRVSAGKFAWVDGAPVSTSVQGVLLLALAGCGMVWMLVLHGSHAGEVWIDATGSDGSARCVAPSFAAWYRGWLAASLRSEQRWIHWDGMCCATANVVGKMLQAQPEPKAGERAVLDLAPGAISITAHNSALADAPALVDPCASCVHLVKQVGCTMDVFVRPNQGVGAAGPSATPAASSWQRLKHVTKKWFS